MVKPIAPEASRGDGERLLENPGARIVTGIESRKPIAFLVLRLGKVAKVEMLHGMERHSYF